MPSLSTTKILANRSRVWLKYGVKVGLMISCDGFGIGGFPFTDSKSLIAISLVYFPGDQEMLPLMLRTWCSRVRKFQFENCFELRNLGAQHIDCAI